MQLASYILCSFKSGTSLKETNSFSRNVYHFVVACLGKKVVKLVAFIFERSLYYLSMCVNNPTLQVDFVLAKTPISLGIFPV